MTYKRLIPEAKMRRRIGKWYIDLWYSTKRGMKIYSIGPYNEAAVVSGILEAGATNGRWIKEGIGDR